MAWFELGARFHEDMLAKKTPSGKWQASRGKYLDPDSFTPGLALFTCPIVSNTNKVSQPSLSWSVSATEPKERIGLRAAQNQPNLFMVTSSFPTLFMLLHVPYGYPHHTVLAKKPSPCCSSLSPTPNTKVKKKNLSTQLPFEGGRGSYVSQCLRPERVPAARELRSIKEKKTVFIRDGRHSSVRTRERSKSSRLQIKVVWIEKSKLKASQQTNPGARRQSLPGEAQLKRRSQGLGVGIAGFQGEKKDRPRPIRKGESNENLSTFTGEPGNKDTCISLHSCEQRGEESRALHGRKKGESHEAVREQRIAGVHDRLNRQRPVPHSQHPLKSRAISPLARRSSFWSSSTMSSLDVQSVQTDMTLHVIIMGTSSSLLSSGPDRYPSAGLELCHQ
ncbi:unnamed protein product [Lupinus luteus]|uniref:Uncharacterized protein n=1 Tax=Lupinus luteus TaxID=3873 RepID=A0AAV1WFE4_LUPLU